MRCRVQSCAEEKTSARREAAGGLIARESAHEEASDTPRMRCRVQSCAEEKTPARREAHRRRPRRRSTHADRVTASFEREDRERELGTQLRGFEREPVSV